MDTCIYIGYFLYYLNIYIYIYIYIYSIYLYKLVHYILYIFIKNMNFRIKSNNINSETTENNSTKLMLVTCYYNIFLKL